MSIEAIEHMEKMKLHEVIDFDKYTDILKVPHGWLYRCYDTQEGNITAMAFVPDNLPREARPPVQLSRKEVDALLSDKPFCSECGGSGSIKDPCGGYDACVECRGTGYERGDEG